MTNGISQRDRFPAQLDPAYFQIDERSVDDLLLFVTELAAKFNYYNQKNEIDGDWLDFFLSDANLLLRLLSAFDFKRYELQYNKHRYALLNLASEEEFNKELRETFEHIYEFILFQYGIFEKFKRDIVETNAPRLLICAKLINFDKEYEAARIAFYSASLYFQNDPAYNFRYKNKAAIEQIIREAEGKSLGQITAAQLPKNAMLVTEVTGIFDTLFIKFDIMYNQLRMVVDYLQKENRQEKIWYKPHISMLLSFFELYQVLKKEMNSITGKHLDFYYRQLLEIEARKPEPDKVSVIVNLNKEINEFSLEAGESFLATLPGIAEKQVFKLKEDTFFTRAKIAALHSIYKKSRYHGLSQNNNDEAAITDCMVYSATCPVADAAAITKKKSQDRGWPLFGEDQKYLSREQASMQLAEMGLLIASPVLLTEDGKRTFNITLYLKPSGGGNQTSKPAFIKNREEVRKILTNAFIIDITGAHEWIQVSEYHVNYSADKAGQSVKIKFILDTDDPAVGVYQPIVHGNDMGFRKPAIRLMLNFNKLHNPFDFFQWFEIDRISFHIDVRNSCCLQLKNNNGKVLPTAPFQLFGPVPVIGNYLEISNSNIFNRFTRSFDIVLKWDGLPLNADGFTSYYAGYETGITNDSFKVSVSSTAAGSDQARKKDDNLISLFSMNDDELSQYLSGYTTLSQSQFPKMRFDNEMNLESKPGAEQEPDTGTVRIELAAPAVAFGHQLYPVVFPKVLMHNSKWYVLKQKPTPNPPYAPVVNSVQVNYELEYSEIISGTKGNDAKGQIELFHICPFGYRQVYPQLIQEPVKVVPFISSQCNLYIGLQDVTPGKVITFLFQLEENNYDELGKNIQPFNWHFLRRNKWEVIDRENILEDNTYGFKGTGTVKLLLPENISNGNSLFDPAYYWIRISGNNKNGSRVKAIFTQVATVVRHIGNEEIKEALSMEPDCVKELSRKIPEIKEIHQPFPSYHGQISETANQYYARISELLRHKNRAITATDISQKILEQFPQVHKVLCFNSHSQHAGSGDVENIRVFVIPKVDITDNGDTARLYEPKISIYGLYKIQSYLNEIVSPVVKVNVYNPIYEKIKVVCSVRFKKGKRYENTGMLVQKLNQELRIFITPWLYKRNLDINTNSGIYPGEILNFIKDQVYVDMVKGFNVIHFYEHTDAGTGKTGGRLMESHYFNKNIHSSSFEPKVPDHNMKLILKGSRPGAILISSRQHMITVLDEALIETNAQNIDKLIKSRSGIGRLAIGEEFLVMNPYRVSEYPGISQTETQADGDTFDFIF